ncbi:3-isopropylmalate dehydratase large subunit [Pseudomonas helleri]|uniref:3-isopropylmalate dehydratase large subunit n=1 Tax=Pseudomonas helleri TaxID=1608996 RepID=A0A6L5HXZ2_9PSED|nr:3-isopropylmalate dehydratase large subunit [Pseudomonas helleri]MQU08153.1 3-isopropylmalate dehydratase large subunit [Pseudomonas helleri]
MPKKTLYQKLWEKHKVCETSGFNALIYIDRHLINEVTSPQAFEGLENAGRPMWRPDAAIASADHNVPTSARAAGIADPLASAQVDALASNCERYGILHYGMNDARQGILHVISPELGATQPGMTIACGDSHTSTHGAFGALAFGIGTSEIEHLLATQCLMMRPLKTMNISVTGKLQPGVTSKDLALHIIGLLSTSGATGHAIEFSGDTVRSLSMEARMTLCNMSIEAGARVGMIGVDETTIAYLKDRPFSPSGVHWERAVPYWKSFTSDPGASFDHEMAVRADKIYPYVTWGTTPDMCSPISGNVPDRDAIPASHLDSYLRAMEYMGLEPGMAIADIKLDKIFIGSCTNARIEDLRLAAKILKGKRIAPTIRQALVVPGSGSVKAQAELEGLDKVFVEAGFEWRDSGCSMCLGMNEDRLLPGERCASTSNRNFEGRQGAGGRSHLVSPPVAAAAAIAGRFTTLSV